MKSKKEKNKKDVKLFLTLPEIYNERILSGNVKVKTKRKKPKRKKTKKT